MRLIDADELIKKINNDNDFAKNISFDIDERLVNGFYKGYVEAEIRLMPTAYDIDKAIEELDKLADESYRAYCISFNSDDRAEYDAYTNAIEIVTKMATLGGEKFG